MRARYGRAPAPLARQGPCGCLSPRAQSCRPKRSRETSAERRSRGGPLPFCRALKSRGWKTQALTHSSRRGPRCGEEGRVVREADVHAGADVYVLSRGVEGLDDERHLLGAGGGSGFIDLDPFSTGLDETLYVRAHHVPCRVPAEPLPSLGPTRSGGAQEHAVFGVVLVVGPVDDGVGAGEGGLHDPLGVATDELVLFAVIDSIHERLLGDGGLGVVLIVPGADRPAGLEALGVPDGMVVHLAAALLAIVDDVKAGVLQEPYPVKC